MKLSIVIPTYTALGWTLACLQSIREHPPTMEYEVIVVDDCSPDDSAAGVRTRFPEVRHFTNARNGGFSKTVNKGIREARGDYVLVLNSDTWVHPGALDALTGFLDAHPEVGIVGPKVLNRDQSLQKQCRRRNPTPLSALLYLSGLARLFPKNPRIAAYLMTEADENQTLEVDSVSGACMVVRRELLAHLGGFDEIYYLYGEDLDLCLRAKLAGWKVVYFPGAAITHAGGQGGTAQKRMKATVEWHRAIWIFYRTHRAPRAGLAERALVYTGIAMKGLLAITFKLLLPSQSPGTAKP
jgi:GT2 family glycosyltransferase